MAKKTTKKEKLKSDIPKKLNEDYFGTPKVPLKTDYDIAYDFAIKAYEIFQPTVKSIVLFGSSAKGTQGKDSDIDIVIMVDDATIIWDEPLKAWYRNKMQHLVAALRYPKKLHIHTMTITSVYDQIMGGEPLMINVLRYGVSLIDFGGFFQPLKILLAEGKIKPTKESIYVALNRAPVHLAKAKFNILGAVEAYYWAMVDSAHAAVMAAGKTPPSPEHIGILLKDLFVNKGELAQKYVDWYREMFGIAHHVSHGTIADFDHKELVMYRERADEFIGKMAEIVKKYE